MGRNGSGVEVRDTSVRIKFTLNGEQIKERVTVNGKSITPTPANIKYATRLAEEIRRRIELGNFSFADFFPDSPRSRTEQSQAETFGKLADLWHKSQGRLAAATKDQYGTAVRFWKKVIGESRPIQDIDHKYLAAKIGGYPWSSAKTHNNYLIALRGILALEYRGPLAIHNPLNGIENMATVKRLPDPFTEEERNRILEYLKERYDKRVFAYFLWMFFTGMRPEEAIALRWSDIDFKEGIIRVQRVRTFKGAERDGSKTHTVRDVDLMPQAIAALSIMKPYTLMKDGDIFENPVTGKSWHDERSQRDTYWKPALKLLGIRWRRPYNTRHTFATVALMKDAPPGYVASQLGHSTKTLHDKYARWMPENDQGRAKKALSAALSGPEDFGTNFGTNQGG